METLMSARDIVQGIIDKIAANLAIARKRSEFACGDCDRWSHCGLAPSDDCIGKLSQLERDAGRVPRPGILLRQ
jgi:hypothetical protein